MDNFSSSLNLTGLALFAAISAEEHSVAKMFWPTSEYSEYSEQSEYPVP